MQSLKTTQSSGVKHKVLLLGSGLMTPCLVDYLIKFNDTFVTVASNNLDEAKSVVKRNPHFMTATSVDIFNDSQLDELVGKHDAVVSFVPPTMHIPVLKSCLRKHKHLTTSSYVSPDMLKLHDEAKAKGLIFLNEVGLDPGIDIMSTMKVKDEAEARGWKIVSYESYCGGLPVAEQANNPIGYKFSWNPGAAIKASKNKATFKKNGKVVEAPEPLKVAENSKDISVAMKLEVYPNRNSLDFIDRFGMQDCETFIRGTIRFSGFSNVISAFHDIGLTSDDPVPANVRNLRDLAEARFQDSRFSNLNNYSSEAKKAISTLCSDLEEQGQSNQDYRLVRMFCNVDISHIKPHDKEDFFKQLIKTIRFLGFLDAEPQKQLKVKTDKGEARTYLDVFGEVLAEKLSMPDTDRDLVVMRHNFILEDKQKKRWNHYSTLIGSGIAKTAGGPTMMALTVGATAAIGMRLILTGKISQRGVLSPVHKEIYEPIMSELEKLGVHMIEESDRFHTTERHKL